MSLFGTNPIKNALIQDLTTLLYLILQLIFEVGHFLHLSVPARPHAVDEGLDVRHARPSVADVVSQ